MAILTINLPSDVLARLQAEAQAKQQSLEAYDKEWSKFEAELKALERADSEADFARDGFPT